MAETRDGLAIPPLVPAEVDLRDFGFMPLDVRTLLSSSLWIKAKKDPRVAHAAVSLWCESWHQVPAASLPDDDEVLADLARCDAKEWSRIRDRALQHFVRCSDGRLYHRTVAAKALEAWQSKVARRARTKAATEAREAQRREHQVARDVERDGQRNVSRDEIRHDQRNVERDDQREQRTDVHQGTGTGTGTVKGQGDLPPLVVAAAKPRATKKAPDGFEVTAAMRAWAAEKTPMVLVDTATDQFRDHTFANAITDWPGAWRNWMRKAQEFAAQRQQRPGATGPQSFAERTTTAKAARLHEMTGGLLGAAPAPAKGSDVIDMEASDGTPRLLA